MTGYENVPGAELLRGLAVADPLAAAELCARQEAAELTKLDRGAALLGDVTAELQLAKTDELLAFKFPEAFEPVPTDVLSAVLRAACEGDAATVRQRLAGSTFAELMVFRSLAANIKYRPNALAGLAP